MAKRKLAPYKNGEFTLGQRRDERGNAEAVADYRDANGKRCRARLGVNRADEEAAKRALDHFADDVRAAQARQRQLTVGQVWELWMKEREADKYDNTIYNYHWRAMKPWFGNRSPLLLEAQDFRDYAKSRLDSGRKAATVNTELRRLNSCFKWAFETRKLPFRPKVWIPSAGDGRQRVLTIDEARRILAVLDRSDPHIRLFIIIAFATGARHMAILDLTWDRIDFDNGIITFDEDLPPDPMSKAWRKGRATVPMNKAVREALKTANEGRLTDSVIEHGGERLVSVRDGFRNAMERAGIGHYVTDDEGAQMFKTDVTPHTIRHTVATWLDEMSIATSRTAQLLGHEDEETTKRHYTHTSVEVLRPVVEALDNAFAPLPKISLVEVEEGGSRPLILEKLSHRDSDDIEQIA